MSSRSKKKKRLRSLTHKVEHLRLEVEDRDETVKEYESEFMKVLADVTDGSISQSDPTPPPQQINVGEPSGESIVSGKKTEELPDDIKKVWKTIALMTHPDRTKNDPEMTELYLAAARAAEEGSVDEILRIAAELNIDVPDESPVIEAKLESLAGELEEKLKNLEGSVLWQWGRSTPEVRERIMDMFIKMKGMKKKIPAV